MKNISLAILAGLVFLTSCQKQNDELFPQEQPIAAAGTVQLSAWQGAAFTANGTDKGSSSFSSEISDPSIDAAILSDGLVLVYSKENNKISTLPFTQSSGIEWNYEIKNGGISISASTSKAVSSLTGLEFAYVVIPAEKIASFEEKGTSVNDLINLSYASAAGLFTGNATASNQ